MSRSTLPLVVTNVQDGETVHQRCLLITGQCANTGDSNGYISIKTIAPNSSELFPEQTWPTAAGNFKVLTILSPGLNKLYLSHVAEGLFNHSIVINLNYVPLLQNPPLHLAIMIAKDSPCIIDCPPHKAAGVSSAHSDLDAAIAKFRMTAYMWQAMTAEDIYKKGLGRRTFRLDEEWGIDTVSQTFLNAQHDTMLGHEGAMRSTARIHVIRSSKTVKEIRHASVAQQNPSAGRKDALFDYFMEALRDAGGPFTSSAHPIVAGMILDSHYSPSQKLILGHAALGCHDSHGISLGMMGSHLTYAWPRFIEEVVACLSDVRAPGDKVGNDNGECGSMWEACAIGQGAHMHEVGHAFGSPHRPGIMERGYAQDWPKNFLSKTAYCSKGRQEGWLVDDNTPNNACWNDADALSFRMLLHFRLPVDPLLTPEERGAKPTIVVDTVGDDEEKSEYSVLIRAPNGIARITFNDEHEAQPTAVLPLEYVRYTEAELSKRFDRANLRLNVLGYNGKEATVANVWKLLRKRSFINIPGSSIRLTKRSTWSNQVADKDRDDAYEWAQLLRKKGKDGSIYRATSIDLRVGCLWDGGVVKYADKSVSHWGPMYTNGRRHHFGGHASEEIKLPEGVEITRVEVNRDGWHELDGVRVHLADGTARGELNKRHGSSDIVSLEPTYNEVIVGFYGQSSKESFNGVMEFGIITAPKDVGLNGLPDAVYDMCELRNTAGMEEEGDQHNDNDGNESDDTMDCDDEDDF